MRISIFGLGYVGCVSAGCLSQNGHHVIGIDISQTKVDQINSGKATIIEKDIEIIIAEQRRLGKIEATTDAKFAVKNTETSIIAVGTPSTEKGHLNLDFIFKVAESIGDALREKRDFHTIVIRSTIFPGTCDKIASLLEKNTGKKRNKDFALVDNPEFLREGTAVHDYYNPPLTLIGSDNRIASEKIAGLYKHLPGEIIITSLKVAEIMKYVNNSYHALKISFANEVGNICKELGIDSNEVMEIFCKDKKLNISANYFRPGFAYGGSCLPKDLLGLKTLAHDLYIDVPVIENIGKSNENQINRAIRIILSYGSKKIGFLGLSFKSGTDDLRNSPAVSLVETLLGRGCKIKVFDKNINLSIMTGTNKEYIDSKIPHLAGLMVEDASAILHDSDVIVMNTKEEEYIEVLKHVSDKIIIDLVNLDENVRIRHNYVGINW